ncbi:NAD-dependent epimerase/dehydratase family protein [Marinivivus vitaminiproducens]|uniref:NAD-dependent epimerase/dehydratase family protein n=1 Tax=Marinivivus vitaminiproducens TaxID=3035935 RepID=UPI00279FCF78|nr:NAD(P)-dependent oxidoreductase [Geminicoccaceae bacterium SCSIO 64248]
MSTFAPPATVLITGGGGNLGRKLTAHLLTRDWCRRVVVADLRADPAAFGDLPADRFELVQADLSDPRDRRWQEALGRVEGVVHLAAQNPYPSASWADAAASVDITANLAAAAAKAGTRRIVFATSNHVMGGYKDAPLADGLEPGGLTTDLPPAPGTKWNDGTTFVDSTAYATAKLMGERIMRAQAEASGGALSTVSIRIGWCQPGDNRPETLSVIGTASKDAPPAATDADARRALAWYRNMWLSNPDLLRVVESALTADPSGWPSRGVVVNAMSANRGMAWDIATTERLIGYRARDDVWAHVDPV